VVAEIEDAAVVEDFLGGNSQRILAEALAALRAEIESQLLEDIIADLTAGSVFQVLQEILDLSEVIPIVFLLLAGHGIKGRGDFDPHDVSQIVRGIQLSFAQIASVVNHGPAPE
jgi:hypothetical protein